MTPRGVQVWFQNRRAKTKQQAKKAEAANASKSSADPASSSASSNHPIAPRPSGELDDDGEDAAEPSSALPPSPLPHHRTSDDHVPEVVATADSAAAASATANAKALLQDNEQSNATSDSRRASIAHPNPRPGWSASSPSVSTAPPPPSTAPSSALSSPVPASHVHSHVRLSTHPPSATPSSYSHNHLAPTEIYSQRRTSLPPSLSSSLSGGLGSGMGVSMMSSLRRRGGYDPNARRRSTDLGGHRIVAHPYISVAQSANGPHHFYADGEDGIHPQQQIRRPTLVQRTFTTPFASNVHTSGAQATPSPQVQHLHAHSQPILPSQAQQRPQPSGPQRQHYDISPIQVSVSHSQGYNQPSPHLAGHGYDLFAPRHSIDGSALGLTQAHAHMSVGVSPLHPAPSPHSSVDHDAFSMGMGMGAMSDPARGGYAISQRPVPAPVPGPLPSPNYSFGNPFMPAANGSSSSSTSNSASGTPPNAASPPLLSFRRTSESGVSDGDTEESSGAPLSRFGSIASINGSEASWTSAYVSDNGAEGEEGDMCASRKMSCASEFLGMFSEMEVGSNGGTPAPHGMQEQHQLRHATSSSHLSPHAYAAHQAQTQAQTTDALAAAQQSHMHSPPDADGYPSPSSASTVSAGSNHGGSSNQQHTMSHDTTQSHTTVANGSGLQGQNHPRTNTSSELAYALQADPEPARAYQRQQASTSKGEPSQLQYPVYGAHDQGETDGGDQMAYAYVPEHAQHTHREYAKGQVGQFPTLYEGYVYPPSLADGQPPEEEASAMNQAYAAGAIELSHMCVPASEGVHFMGGYMQYS
ncbi:hypothetical protein OH77DRAFT_1401165 [Trametes cingulata]|nr:hypothetical protein OH77DRAFT_1401165 [Trametes cingulata]